MLNPNEKEGLKAIENRCKKEQGFFIHSFENNVETEKYNEQQELKVFLEKCENLGYLEIKNEGSYGNNSGELWRITITAKGSVYLNS